MTRPTPSSYYYSGQGRLAIGDRDPATGAYSNLTFVGNVTSLTIDLSTDKFEHKESMSGNRAIDLTVVKEKKPTFKFTAESLSKRLMAIGFYGTEGTQATGAIVDEQAVVKITGGAGGVGGVPAAIALKHPNVYNVVINKQAGGTLMVLNTDYFLDGEFGTVYPVDTAAVADGDVWLIDYNYAPYDRVDAFMSGTPPEKYIRFEGLNTVNGSMRLIEIPRAAFDPLTGLEFINEELGSGEFAGNIIEDPFIVAGGISKYFTEKRFAAGSNHA
jgi:hypothetical protein